MYTEEPDILAGIIFGGLLEKGRKLQLADINLAVSVRSPRLSLRGWRNNIIIGGFNIDDVTRIRQSAKYNSPPIFPAIRYTCSPCMP